jgi:hypothetical protein
VIQFLPFTTWDTTPQKKERKKERKNLRVRKGPHYLLPYQASRGGIMLLSRYFGAVSMLSLFFFCCHPHFNFFSPSTTDIYII